MGAEENIKLAQRAYEAFNAHDFDAVSDVFADDFEEHGVPPGVEVEPGPAGVKQLFDMFFTAFPDLSWETLNILADDNHVMVRYRVTGTHEGEFMGIPPTGRNIDYEGVDFVRINDDGEVAEHWDYSDTLTMLQQLGVVSEQDLPG